MSAFPCMPGDPGVVPGMAWYALGAAGVDPASRLPALRPAGYRLLESALFRDAEHVRAVRDAGLHLGAAVTGIDTSAEIAPALDAARKAGAAYVRLKLLTAWHDERDVAAALDELQRVSHDLALPVHVETHRDTASQDLLRWIRHVEQRPDLRLTLDVSHYRIVGDWPQQPRHPRQAEAMRLVLARTSGLHLRICDGEHIQVPPGDAGPLLAWHRDLWRSAVDAWRAQAPPEASFPAVVELLGPPFAQIDPRTGAERSDRWTDALALLSLVQSLT